MLFNFFFFFFLNNRQLLFTVALEVTSEELEEMKHMASDHLPCNTDDIKDGFQLLTALERNCAISETDVQFLCDILSSQMVIDKVEAFQSKLEACRRKTDKLTNT